MRYSDDENDFSDIEHIFDTGPAYVLARTQMYVNESFHQGSAPNTELLTSIIRELADLAEAAPETLIPTLTAVRNLLDNPTHSGTCWECGPEGWRQGAPDRTTADTWYIGHLAHEVHELATNG